MRDPFRYSVDLPSNLAVITLRRILQRDVPVLYVSHDADDGCWQFLDGQTPDLADAMVVGLAAMFSHDPSLAELADLPIGWIASRETPTSTWHRCPNPAEASLGSAPMGLYRP
jgi:hypothetical protein